MRADFSRLTFDAAKHYVGVLHQQGRVWLDADWNEDLLDRLYTLQQETRDIIGACGVPAPGTAFKIGPNLPPGDPLDFRISGGAGPLGRYYVQGLLCQLDADATYFSQPDYPDPPRISLPTDGRDLDVIIYLEAWQRLISYLEDESMREIALGGPDTTARLKTIAQVKVLALPGGDRQLTCEEASALIPKPGQGTLTTLQPPPQVQLDPCRIPDPGTYTGRENHFYRVEVHEAGDVLGSATGAAFRIALAANAPAGSVKLILGQALSMPQVDALTRSGIVTVADADGHTETLALASASGTEVLLARGISRAYGVDRAAGLSGGVARFKWSRDNAAFAVRVLAVGGGRQTLTLASLGRDAVTALRQGDIVEISDDSSELGPAPGHLGHLTYLTADPDPDAFTVTIADRLPSRFHSPAGLSPTSPPSSPPASPPGGPVGERHLLLRRWDGWGWAQATFGADTTPDMDFGDGVHIRFGGQDLRSLDFWQFAARKADGSVEPLVDAPPRGIMRFTCPLAIGRFGRAVQIPIDIIPRVLSQLDVSGAQLEALATRLKLSGQTTLTPAELEQIGRDLGLSPAQLDRLAKILLELEREFRSERPVLQILEDCREPFDPLTKLRCECTVLVAPGESLRAALARIGPQGGEVCLLPGLHELTEPVQTTGKNGLTIRGAGTASVVIGRDLPVLLSFAACENLVLRDFMVIGGDLGSGGSGGVTGVAPTGAEFPGVVTVIDCSGVRIENCAVVCAPLPNQKADISAERTCLSVFGQTPAAATVGSLIGVGPQNRLEAMAAARRLIEKAPPDQPPDGSELPAAAAFFPPVGAGADAPVRQQLPSVDLVVRNCRLFVGAGEIGLLAAQVTGAAIEDNWVAPLAALAFWGGPGATRPGGASGALASLGMAFTDCNAVHAQGNIVIDTFAGLVVVNTPQALAGEARQTWLSDNYVASRGGPAVWVQADGDELILAANRFIGVVLAEATVGSVSLGKIGQFNIPSVAYVIARAAQIQSNRFQTLGSQQPPMAVEVAAATITYVGNASTCQALPLLTNVGLLGLGSGYERTGSVIGVANVCREPRAVLQPDIAGRLQPLRQQLIELENRQRQAVSAYFTNQLPAADFQGHAADLEKQRTALEASVQAVIASVGFGPRISLVAIGAFAVTGMNLLSYELRRFGVGSDTGTQSGVF